MIVRILEARVNREVVDALPFWSEDDIKRSFPILCRIAAQVFAQEATAGDMERINSPGEIFYTPHRNRVAPEIVKKMILLYGYYVREDGGLTTRQRLAKERSSKFILHQSISCQIDVIEMKRQRISRKSSMTFALGFTAPVMKKPPTTTMIRR